MTPRSKSIIGFELSFVLSTLGLSLNRGERNLGDIFNKSLRVYTQSFEKTEDVCAFGERGTIIRSRRRAREPRDVFSLALQNS